VRGETVKLTEKISEIDGGLLS